MATETPSVKEIILQEAAQALGPEALETVDLENLPHQPPKDSAELPDVPPCMTQNPVPTNLTNGPIDLMVGTDEHVPRWEPGAVIKWSAWRMGYKTQDDADYAAQQLALAAEKWNEAKVGVTFEFVPLAQDATFVVCHGGSNGTVLASAFFPNAKDLNFVYVYSYAFVPGWRENLWKVLTHELGHVLGLRHEFAMDTGRLYEGGAVQVGERNEFSVMNYRREPPEIQPSDIASTQAFYKLNMGDKISQSEIIDYTPR